MEARTNDAKIINNLQKSSFTAEKHFHRQIEQKIQELATLVDPTSYFIGNEIFQLIAADHLHHLSKMAIEEKCLVEMNETVEEVEMEVARADKQEHISGRLVASAIKVVEEDLALIGVSLCLINEETIDVEFCCLI